MARKHAWDDLASTFLERFVAIASALEHFGRDQVSLWDPDDGFFYDVLTSVDGSRSEPLRLRSLVGLLPMLAVALAPEWVSDELTDFNLRLNWLEKNLPGRTANLMAFRGRDERHVTLSPLDRRRFSRLLGHLFDAHEFLSPYGIRSLSAAYRNGITVDVAGTEVSVSYDPGESTSGMFGGNSNWRGPIWLPIYLLFVDALRFYSEGAGRDLEVDYPTGSGQRALLADIVNDLEARLVSLFRPGPDGQRPGDQRDKPRGPLWDEHVTFSEYFNGDTGEGLGASHQTGWTALVAHLVCTAQTGPRLTR